MKTVSHIAQLIKMGQFRRDKVKLFKDFVERAALSISVKEDPVHRTRRMQRLRKVEADHTPAELAEMDACLRTLAEEILEKTSNNLMEDILGRAYEEHNLCDPGQDFTFPDVSRLLNALGLSGELALPKCDFFDFYEHACGAGSIVLSAAELLQSKGINYTNHMVVYANDIDEMCVHMAYVQIALHGIPAVVARANTITNEEFERWYTPQYIRGQWIIRRPFSGNSEADCLLKCCTVPHYAAIQEALMLERQPINNEGDEQT